MMSGHGRIDANREKILNQPVLRTLITLGLPLMIVQLVNISYNLADAFWLQMYRNVEIAVPRQVFPTFMLINAFAQGIVAANTAIITQYIGAKMYDDAKRSMRYFVSFTIISNVVLASIYFVLRPLIFTHIVRVPAEIYDPVMWYSGIITLDMIGSALTLTYSTIFMSIGDSRTPAVVNAVAALTNVVLDPFLILGFNIKTPLGFDLALPPMGATGAAAATVASRFVGIIALMRFLSTKYPFLKTSLTLNISRYWIKTTLRAGMPVTILMSTNSLAFMVQNGLINSFGVKTSAAAAIGFLVMDLADAVLWGFTSSVAVLVGQSIGAGLYERAKSVALKSSLFIGSASGVGSLLAWVFRAQIIGVFTQDPEIAYKADEFVNIFISSLPFFAVFMVGMSVGRGSGHTTSMSIIAAIRLWGVRIFLAYILAFYAGMGETGIWIAMASSNYVGGVAMLTWMWAGSWNRPIIKTAPVRTGTVSTGRPLISSKEKNGHQG